MLHGWATGIPNQSPLSACAARPQTNNDSSDFTQDVVRAAQIVVSWNAITALIGIAVDGVSVECRDVMQGNSSFLDGESTFAADVDNKHNMKNTNPANMKVQNTIVILVIIRKVA